jgi:hypothetical protein
LAYGADAPCGSFGSGSALALPDARCSAVANRIEIVEFGMA